MNNIDHAMGNEHQITKSIEEFVKSVDPLSEEAFDFLLNYREEELFVDYKETFHPQEEREWLELTKDVLAFANTFGGYLVFGVRNATYELIGLPQGIIAPLLDINNIRQKINRYVEPDIGLIRSKHFARDGRDFVAVFVPASKEATHIISKDGAFKFPRGGESCSTKRDYLD